MSEAVEAHMRGFFHSFDLFIDEKMRRSNRLFSKVEKICQISGDNSPLKQRFFSMAIITNEKTAVLECENGHITVRDGVGKPPKSNS